MGIICTSIESNNATTTTAKLILQDGSLEEFSYPVKVSCILAENPTCFICNSDDIDFDSFVSAIDGDEELQLGELYFALPSSWLNRPIRAQEMAFLTAKASIALKMDIRGEKNICCGVRLGRRRLHDLVFSTGGSGGFGRFSRINDPGGLGGGSDDGGCGGGYNRVNEGGRFVAKLSVILEE